MVLHRPFELARATGKVRINSALCDSLANSGTHYVMKQAKLRPISSDYAGYAPATVNVNVLWGICCNKKPILGQHSSYEMFHLEQSRQRKLFVPEKLAEACGSRTHHSTREGPNRRL